MAALPASSAKSPVGGTLVVAALVVVLAYQLAHWTWVFMAPARQALPAIPEPTIDLAQAAKLFGGNATSSSAVAAATSALRLKGVIAPTPGTSASAIFNIGSGRDLAVFVGSEVQPGAKLVEVFPDYVILSRGGIRERIDLEVRRASAVASPLTRPTGFRIRVAQAGANSFSLSRRELDEALKDPGQLNYLGRIGVPPGGGVRMEEAPAGSLAQKLGLQPGDVIRKVNGQAVASAGDLARLYQQFGTLSAVQVEVQRGAATVRLTYQIQ